MIENIKKIKFIINPISGVGRQKIIEQLIEKCLDKKIFDYDISYSERPKHAIYLSNEAALHNYDIVVAVGGDGSVNEVSQGLVGYNTALAIIPTGSGNGLARHLKIPLDLKKAIEIINKCNIQKIDTATLNDLLFVSIAGVGFDAKVAKDYAKSGIRGFKSYFKAVLRNYFSYRQKKYTLFVNGEKLKRKALFISFANSNQFGYNTSIAPEAKIDDGLLNICIVRRPFILLIPFVAFKLFTMKAHKSKYVETIKVDEIIVKSKKIKNINIDGEIIKQKKLLTVRVNPKSLNVVVP